MSLITSQCIKVVISYNLSKLYAWHMLQVILKVDVDSWSQRAAERNIQNSFRNLIRKVWGFRRRSMWILILVCDVARENKGFLHFQLGCLIVVLLRRLNVLCGVVPSFNQITVGILVNVENKLYIEKWRKFITFIMIVKLLRNTGREQDGNGTAT